MPVNKNKITTKFKNYIIAVFLAPFVVLALWILCDTYLVDHSKNADINFYNLCGETSPIRMEIPELPTNKTFKCDVNIDQDGLYTVALQYPYNSREEKHSIRSMLGDSQNTIKNVNGHPTVVRDVSGDMSYAIYNDGKKIIGKNKIFPNISSYVFGKYGGIETQFTLISLKKGQKYTVYISGIPERFRAYRGIYLIVRKEIF